VVNPGDVELDVDEDVAGTLTVELRLVEIKLLVVFGVNVAQSDVMNPSVC
jgi:hypothetical protein